MDDKRFASLLAALHDTDQLDRAVEAANDLEAMEDRTRLPALYELLEQTDDLFVREMVGIAIAKMDGLTALPRLLAATHADGHDYDGLVTRIIELVEGNPGLAVPMLLNMLDKGTPEQRADAANLLGFVSGSTTPRPLIDLLESDDQRLRAVAVGSLGSFTKSPEVFKLLEYLALHDSNEQVRRSAVGGLLYARNPKAIDTIQAAVNDPSEYVRDYAKEAMERR